MPESRRRKPKKAPTPAMAGTARVQRRKPPSRPWVPALMLACFLIGVAWLLIYYFSSGGFPGMGLLGAWNVFAGFAFVVVGLGVATQWR
ncbi:MAG: cell division protein CrgA [Frankia sp.]